MRKNVLIYPGNGVNAVSVYKCLEDSLRYRPILGNHGHAYAEFMTEDFNSSFPLITELNFFDFLNQYITENEIYYIIPTHDTVAEFLMENQDKILATVVCSDKETAKVCRHKGLTYSMFSETEFVPIQYSRDTAVYPLFAKDDIGQGGKNSRIIHNVIELDKIYSQEKDIDYILTEFLPGKEITVDCFTNRHKELLFVQARERASIINGLSGLTKFVDMDDDIEYIAKTINSKLNFRGYWYFQCKQDQNGKYKLMEVSARFAGTFIFSANLDVNFPLLTLSDFDNIDVKILPNHYKMIADRCYQMQYRVDCQFDRVYLDFDDTLVFGRKKYNIKVVAFLFDCINKGKEVILITRHAYNIHETLQKLSLSEGLFSRIIELVDNECKSDYIMVDKPCIFVDNSFKERIDVKTKLGIPTFDTFNLEILYKI